MRPVVPVGSRVKPESPLPAANCRARCSARISLRRDPRHPYAAAEVVAARCVGALVQRAGGAPRFDICASFSAYRGAAVLFKLFYVLVAAAQLVPRLVRGFCCAAAINAHGAQRDGGTAIEWSAHCSASR
jgi:hypothetical protein